MVVFKRTICSVDIAVYIQSDLYETERELFNRFLNSFIFLGKCDKMTNGLFITNRLDETEVYENVLYCDITDPYWEYRLIVALEDYLVRSLGSTVIHASCVRFQDQVILLPGSRMSGKSSIAKYFIENLHADYLADDFVFVLDNKVYGFRFPISMREKSISKYSYYMTLDFDNKKRYLYYIPGNYCYFDSVDIIIFPHYNPDCFSFTNIDKIAAFNKIISNVKHFESKRNLFSDLNKLISSGSVFQLEYDSFDHLNDILYHILDQ